MAEQKSLPKYLSEIKVKYHLMERGNAIARESTLAELLSDGMADERQNIQSLVILPRLKKNGELNSEGNPLQYLSNFPVLKQIVCPSQWEYFDVEKIQKNGCFQLSEIVRSVPIDYKGQVEPARIKIKKPVEIQEKGEVEADSYATLLEGTGTAPYSIIQFDPRTEQKKRVSNKKSPFATSKDVAEAILEIKDRLTALEGQLTNQQSTNITVNNIENYLTRFVGRIKTEELDHVINAIQQGISVNIPNESMEQLEAHLKESLEKGMKPLLDRIKLDEGKILRRLKEISDSQRREEDSIAGVEEKLGAIEGEVSGIKEKTESIDTTTTNIYALVSGFMETDLPQIMADNFELRQLIQAVGLNFTQEGGVNQKLDELLNNLTSVEYFAQANNKELGQLHGFIIELAKSADEKDKVLFDAIKNGFADLAQTLSDRDAKFYQTFANTLSSIPSISTIQKIAEDAVNQVVGANVKIAEYFSSQIVDQIVSIMGEVNQISEQALIQIRNEVISIVNSEEFKATIAIVLNDQNIAKADSVQEIRTIVEQNHTEVIAKLDQIGEAISNLPTVEDIANAVGIRTDERIDRLEEKLQMMFDALQKWLENGMINKSDMIQISQQVASTQEFKDILEMLKNIQNIVAGQQTVNLNVTVPQQNQGSSVVNNIDIDQVMQTAVNNIVQQQLIYNVIASAMMGNRTSMGGPVIGVPQVDLSAIIPIITAITQGNATNNVTQNNNPALISMMTLLFKNLGLGNGITQDPRYDQLKKELDDFKSSTQNTLDQIKKMIEELKKQQEQDPIPKPIPTDPIEMPKPVGKKKLVQGTIKHLNKIQEPKLSLPRRIGKFIVRHPLRAAAIGLGVGVLGAATGGILAAGGITAALATANSFWPTIAIGAGVGGGGLLTAGAIGSVVSHLTKKGKKERLYAKFLKQKAKCDSMKEDIIEKHEKQQERREKINELQEKQRSGNRLLKSLGVYKIAKNVNRKKLKKLRTKTRQLESKHKSKVSDALSTKKKLNTLEQTSGSLAMGGTLQKLRKTKADLKAKLSNPSLEDDEREELVEEYKDAIEDAEIEVEGVSTLSDTFETFDTEAEELINSVKGTPSRAMKDILADIRSRNAERELHAREVPVFDDAELQEYYDKVEKSENPVDKDNATKLKAFVDRVRAEEGKDLATLVREGRIDPALARQLLTQDTVRVPGNEVVDIEFQEVSDDQERDSSK